MISNNKNFKKSVPQDDTKVSVRVYLDYAASTPLDSRVKKAMEPFWSNTFGNAGAIHKEGLEAKEVLENSRKKVARILSCKPEEIIFTGSGTESNSLAIIGFLNYLENDGQIGETHIITSQIEHPSVLEVFKRYEQKGLKVDFLGVYENGVVDLEELKNLLTSQTKFVSIMYANNEIGVIQPIREISNILNEYNKNIVFHTDASQAPLYLNINVESLGVDMLTIDAQKIYGPKGVGLLYKKRDVDIAPVLIGGSQEGGLRPGTENIPLIVGLSRALEIADEEKEDSFKKVTEVRDYFLKTLLKIDRVKLNGSKEKRLPNNINVSISGKSSEFLVLELDNHGIACATKSACIRSDAEGSYVVEALGRGESTGIRFSLGKETSKRQIDTTLEALKEILGK